MSLADFFMIGDDPASTPQAVDTREQQQERFLEMLPTPCFLPS